MQKKPFIIMIGLLLAILLGGAVTYFLMKEPPEEDPNDIDLIIERSIETEQAITTSLQNGTIIQVSFKFQTDSLEAKEELEKRMFQVKNTIINHFANKTTADFEKDGAIEELENTIKNKINKVMTHGEIEKIYTTSYVLQ
ncbi:flagellar basal body-associated FliL family protein [Rossellomorea aquimaris]|nr:flagellar basal body-associated FliL family protein [Rossellomorea aquimaris]